MDTYIFDLGQLGEVRIAAVNRISAEEQFVEMGYCPCDIVGIAVKREV